MASNNAVVASATELRDHPPSTRRLSLRRAGSLSAIPFHPVVFAAYPVVLLFSNNLFEVNAWEAVAALVTVVGLAALGYGLLLSIWRAPERAAIVVSWTVLSVLMFGRVRDAVAPYWTGDRLILPLALAAGLSLIVAWLARPRGSLRSLTQALNAAALVLVLTAAIPFLGYGIERWNSSALVLGGVSATELPGDGAVGATTDAAAFQRDIYHLVFDRYGSDLALELFDDVSNTAFSEWLRDQGFHVASDARANYVRTQLSLASTLTMAPINDIAEALGPDTPVYDPVYERMQRSRVGAFLQDRGYEYIHVGSWWDHTRKSDIADRIYNPDVPTNFGSALIDMTMLPTLFDAMPTEQSNQVEAAHYQFDLLDSLREDPGPKYVFAHILVPHPPYVLLADGTAAWGEATHASQLEFTNARIRQFLEPLLALPEDRRPIVILQGDEGPRPIPYEVNHLEFDWDTASDEQLVMKFGILNALLLPGPAGVAPMPDTTTPVNTYPEVFRRYFGVDFGHHPDRSYSSPARQPFDFSDITDRFERALERL